MGKTNLSPHDLELLSAYLDKELSSKDTARLEARLWQDTDLRNALDELDRTRMMLRSLPRVRAPRNFTLSAQYARQKAPTRWYPMFGFASALAAVLLIVVLAGDWMGLWLPAKVALAPEPTASSVVVDAPFLYDAAATDNTEARAITETPAIALKVLDEPSSTVTITKSPSPSPTPSATASVEPSLALETLVESETPSPTQTERETGMAVDDTQIPLPSATPTDTATSTATPTQTLTLEPSATATLTETVTPSPTVTLAPTATPVVAVAMQPATPTALPATMSPLASPKETPQVVSRTLGDQPILLVLEVGLGILLAFLIVAALWNYLRR